METERTVAETLDRAARRRRVQFAIIGTVLILVTAAGSTGLWLAARSLRQINATSDYLTECTTPSTSTDFHTCYEEGQKRTAEAVKVLFENQAYNRDLIICVLLVPSEDRDLRAKEICEKQARAQLEKEAP